MFLVFLLLLASLQLLTPLLLLAFLLMLLVRDAPNISAVAGLPLVANVLSLC
jgi:hypothetical protein